MGNQRNRTLVGAWLVVWGLLLLMVSNHVLIGWDNLWPCILIVTGDMIDKWHYSLDVIALLRALQTSAAAAGGRVSMRSFAVDVDETEKPVWPDCDKTLAPLASKPAGTSHTSSSSGLFEQN